MFVLHVLGKLLIIILDWYEFDSGFAVRYFEYGVPDVGGAIVFGTTKYADVYEYSTREMSLPFYPGMRYSDHIDGML